MKFTFTVEQYEYLLRYLKKRGIPEYKYFRDEIERRRKCGERIVSAKIVITKEVIRDV